MKRNEDDAARKARLKWIALGYLTEPALVERLIKYHQDVIAATKMNIPRSQVIFRLLRAGLEKEGH